MQLNPGKLCIDLNLNFVSKTISTSVTRLTVLQLPYVSVLSNSTFYKPVIIHAIHKDSCSIFTSDYSPIILIERACMGAMKNGHSRAQKLILQQENIDIHRQHSMCKCFGWYEKHGEPFCSFLISFLCRVRFIFNLSAWIVTADSLNYLTHQATQSPTVGSMCIGQFLHTHTHILYTHTQKPCRSPSFFCVTLLRKKSICLFSPKNKGPRNRHKPSDLVVPSLEQHHAVRPVGSFLSEGEWGEPLYWTHYHGCSIHWVWSWPRGSENV